MLDPSLLPEYVNSGATVIAEEGDDAGVLSVPMAALALKQAKDLLPANTVALGALLALLDQPLEPLLELLSERFAAGQARADDTNLACARVGYEYARNHAVPVARLLHPSPFTPHSSLLVTGAQALALGALSAGARFFTNYPMAPASPVFEYVARHADRLNVFCEQPEDEIAAANMAVGAAFAGAPALTCTSASGFSLMNEALSLAGMTETPLVICLGMRPGPATGMATRTAQADLLFSIHSGHGEFPRVVLSPADAAQAFRATAQAVRLAETRQVQVIVLFDQYMADASWTVRPESLAAHDRHPIPTADLTPGQVYQRYKLTDSGISPRLQPGTDVQVVYADSDEHTPEGHITESAAARRQMVEKRSRKLTGAVLDLPEYAGPAEPEALVCCFGSTRGIVSEAVTRLSRSGHNLAMAHFSRVWPFPRDEVRQMAAGAGHLYTVEGNHTAQLAQLLTQEGRLRIAGSVRKYDGRQFSVAEVETGLSKLIESR
ncbi:2-oxoacid:acceptor oxidoreductase subunit alpha [candidate division WOR-3 bacterium]|nr:2-oxoacid:acceptor oxidoreductase subunit alpha [candidate division WOR-3 bacterium]